MKTGKKRYAIYGLMFAMVGVNYVDRIILSVAAPSISKELNIGPVDLGYLFSSYIWTYLIFLLPFGVLVDRLGIRSIGAASMIVWSFACMTTGIATSYVTLFASRLVLGGAEAASIPVGGGIVRRWAPKAERGLSSAILNSGAYAGLALGSFLVGWLIASFGWRYAFLICGVGGVLAGLFWAWVYRNPEHARWLSHGERAFLLEDKKAQDAWRLDETKIPVSVVLRQLLTSRALLAIALTQGCAGYTLYFVVSWLPSYLASARGMGVLQMSAVTAIPYAATIAICISLATVIDRFAARARSGPRSRRIAIAACLMVSAIILAAPLIEDVRIFLVCMSISMGCVATAMSMNLALANDLLRRSDVASLVTSIVIFGGNAFGLVAPIVTGYLVAGTLGYGGAFAVAGCLLLLGMVSIFFANRGIDVETFGVTAPVPARI
jgi:MFS family permease